MSRIIGSILIGVLLGIGANFIPFGELHQKVLKYYASPAVVKLLAKNEDNKILWGGTGFITTENSGKVVVVTNSHVCGIYKEIALYIEGRTRLEQKSINYVDDLCVLNYPLTPKRILGIASSEIADGTNVYVLGHPLMNPLTLTTGKKTGKDLELMPIAFRSEIEEKHILVSCLEADSNMPALQQIFFEIYCFIERNSNTITAEIKPGSSGSPVMNYRGQVVGVVWGYDPEDNTGLAVPLSKLRNILGYGEMK
jgi:S1-C subfamily serine protease